MINVQQKRGKQFAAQCGGFGRAVKYSHQQLSAWASRGGKALLQQRGREYFRELKKKQKLHRPRLRQMSARVVSAKMNGRRGGKRRAQLYSADQLRQWARLGGIAVKARFGSDHFRKLRLLRTQKSMERMQSWKAKFDRRFPPQVRQRLDELLNEIGRLF